MPDDLARVALRAMEKVPERRYRDARELSEALTLCLPCLARRRSPAAGWPESVSLGDVDAAPTPRPLAPPPRLRLDWRAMGRAAATLAFLLTALSLGSGWQLTPSALTLEAEEIVRVGQPTPTRTPVPTPGPPVIIVYEPIFVTPSPATPTPLPSPTPPTTTTPSPAAPTARALAVCETPPHSNPAIAEAFAVLVGHSCGTPLEQTVAEAIGVALERGTDFRFEQPTTAAWGYFDPAENRVTLAPTVATEPVEARAALLLHELVHARDHFQGGLMRTSGVLGCYDVELRAYSVQVEFWRLVRDAGVKVSSPIADDLDSISRQIEKDSSEFVMRELVARYGSVCSP